MMSPAGQATVTELNDTGKLVPQEGEAVAALPTLCTLWVGSSTHLPLKKGRLGILRGTHPPPKPKSLRKLPTSSMTVRCLGGGEIHPAYLRSPDLVGLSWLTCLCSVNWWLGTAPLEQQTKTVAILRPRECVPATGDHTCQLPQEGLH